MPDRISRYRVARLNLYPPQTRGGQARWCLLAHTIRAGIPNAVIVLDGVLSGVNPQPTTEELLEAFDAILRQSMLPH